MARQFTGAISGRTTQFITGLSSLAALLMLATFTQAQDCANCSPQPIARAGCFGGNCTWNRPYTEESSPDVFYNFYQPGNGGQPAAAYPAPYPTPAFVGHQYTTYQPFMPHEWMHMHYRSYLQSYNMGNGLNRTRTFYYSTPVRNEIMAIRKFLSIPR